MSILRDLVASGLVQVRAYRRGPLLAKAYLCWDDNHAELNVRLTGDADMAVLREWFDALWEESEGISQMLALELERSWAIAQTPPYYVYLKALYELCHTDVHAPDLMPQRTEQPANFQLDAVRRGLPMIDARGGCYASQVSRNSRQRTPQLCG